MYVEDKKMFKQIIQQTSDFPQLTAPARPKNMRYHRARVNDELKSVGVTAYGRHKSESKYLPNLIHANEHIMGAVYGNSEVGSVMMVATNLRVIYLDKKPFFVNEDEITYDVVSGVSHWSAGFMSTVNLHSRVRDYRINTTNDKAASQFVAFIEQHCLERTRNERTSR